ncbi:MAG: nucleoside triphosphate pyrophosphohydrolase [Thermotogaceae bacterium]|nr:nucleoside triphosphate pyrophosphohydrolase [Thermotogaceae bacterium]
MSELGESFENLIKVMEVLRAPEGCDWDRAQTHESLKPYLIEEAYELLEAIDEKNDEAMKEELGDVLLQIVFHSQIAKERNAFTMKDVIDSLTDKLIRRHPHVFKKDGKYSYIRWEEMKALEKGKKKKSSIGEVNKALPALSLARRIQENASAVGFDWKDSKGVFEKIKEEISEFERNPSEEEFGDILFSLVNLSRFLNIDPERALRKSVEKFVDRFSIMERLIEKDGKDLKSMDVEEMNKYWEMTKKEMGK